MLIQPRHSQPVSDLTLNSMLLLPRWSYNQPQPYQAAHDHTLTSAFYNSSSSSSSSVLPCSAHSLL
jgi:hypothetical protein